MKTSQPKEDITGMKVKSNNLEFLCHPTYQVL